MRLHRQILYELVDVFTENPLEGNQLAVVFEADDLSDEQMSAVTADNLEQLDEDS